MVNWFRKQPKVPDGPLQPLPLKPGQSAWSKGAAPQAADPKYRSVGARMTMQHFARHEVTDISSREAEMYTELIAVLKQYPDFAKLSKKQIVARIQEISKKLQSSDLTINFKCYKWSAGKNTYKAYTQMYDRGIRTVKLADGTETQEMRLKAGGGNFKRDDADTKVTFTDKASSPQMQGVARFMQTGGLVDAGKDDKTGEDVAKAANAHFNPKARQIFAALNYGQREHASAPYYGESFLILKDELKLNAIYYPSDTFLQTDATKRATYGTLFAIVTFAGRLMRDQIIEVFHKNRSLEDVQGAGMGELLEAHIFDTVVFSKDVKELRLSLREAADGGAKDNFNPPIAADTIKNNAREFCQRNGIKLSFIP